MQLFGIVITYSSTSHCGVEQMRSLIRLLYGVMHRLHAKALDQSACDDVDALAPMLLNQLRRCDPLIVARCLYSSLMAVNANGVAEQPSLPLQRYTITTSARPLFLCCGADQIVLYR